MDMISVPEVHSFLEQFYHSAIVDLSAEFPAERTLPVNWDDIEHYNENWIIQLRNSPQIAISTLEKGLATYPLTPPYGQLSFEAGETQPDDPPFVRIQNCPSESEFNELPQLDGEFTRTIGRVTRVSEPEAQVATAVFVCKRCDDRFSESLVEGETRKAPISCESCDTENTYQFSGKYSTFADSQSVTLAPLNYCNSPIITVELRNELIDSVELNSSVSVTGTVHCTGLSERFPEITMLANSLKQTQAEVPHPTTPHADRFLDAELVANNQFRDKLSEFVERSSLIVEHQFLTEEDAQAKIITPFIHLLGWNVYSEKVRLEYSTSDSAGKTDYMLFDSSGAPRIPVEAKAPNKNLDEFEHQIERYIDTFNTDVGLLTNGEEYRLYAYPSNSESELNHIFTLQLSELPVNESLIRVLRESTVSHTESVSAIFSD